MRVFTSYINCNINNQIFPVTLTAASGYSSVLVNAGEIANKGFEIAAFVVPLKTNDFSWTMNVNFSRNRNEVIELFGEGDQKVTNVPIQTFQGGVSINASVGEPYGVIRGTNFIYTDGQRTVNSAGYYMATTSSAENIGDPNPDWLGGVNNTFKYNDISLSFLIDVRQGGDIFSLDQFYGDGSGLYAETAGLNDKGVPKRTPVAEGGGVVLPGVKEDGSPNDIYANNSNGSGGTAYGYVANGGGGMPRAYYVYDGSYVKLRELALTYSLPTSIVSKVKGLKGVDLSLIGRNLWIIHKNMEYSDPEESLSSGNANQGYQSGAYPAVKTYGFNVRLNF